MKVNLADMTKKVLFEEVGKPTDEEVKAWESKGGKGKLYYVIRGEDNQIREYVDTKLVENYNSSVGKKYKPKQVAEKLFENIGVMDDSEKQEEKVSEETVEETTEETSEQQNDEQQKSEEEDTDTTKETEEEQSE